MAKKNSIVDENEASLSTVFQDGIENYDDKVELVSDPCEIEELSDEAKKMQERALINARDRAMAIIDQKKVPLALKEIESIESYADILNDSEVLERVKENVKTAQDLKYIAEAQKLKLQNLQSLLKMDSVNSQGNAGEIFVGVEFGKENGTTKIVVGKK